MTALGRATGAAAEAAVAAGDRPAAWNETRSSTLADEVENARSFMARFMGLMGRPALPAGQALWLEGNGIHMFFMRFAIDAVFLGKPDADGRRRVVSTHRAVRPWIGLVPLVLGASGVLELPVGAIDASSTSRGDTILLRLDR